jgi:L-lactate dehydrogenase complex protein LldG
MVPDLARERILGRLRGSPRGVPPASDFAVMARKTWPQSERYPRLRRLMEAVKTEFLETTEEGWPAAVYAFMKSQGVATLLYGPDTPAGRRLAQAWPSGEGPRLVAYDRPVEQMKERLFNEVDAGFTTTRGGIAETGGLIVWPSPQEPRLMSLVPPVHLALLSADAIFDTFWDAQRSQGWAAGMPPNALLISGPSKTADIEQTLAYGVHGPKRLVVVVVGADPSRSHAQSLP